MIKKLISAVVGLACVILGCFTIEKLVQMLTEMKSNNQPIDVLHVGCVGLVLFGILISVIGALTFFSWTLGYPKKNT